MATTGTQAGIPVLDEGWIAWRARVDETLRHVATKEDLANLREELAKMKEALTWRILLAMGGFATIVTVLDQLLP